MSVDPAHRVHVVQAQQEEDVGGACAGGKAERDVVLVDQRRRGDGQIQTARRLDQLHQRRVQREQEFSEADTVGPHIV